MKKTVVAIYANLEAAQGAADDLRDQGFTNEQVDVATGDSYAEEDENDNSVARFFKNLFGNDQDDRRHHRYTEVAKKNSILTVYPDSDDQAGLAAEIMDNHQPLDVDKHYEDDYIDRNSDTGDRGEVEVQRNKIVGDDHDDVNFSQNRDFARKENNSAVDGEIDNDELVEEEGNRTIPVMEERMRVDKKKVQTGGIRLRSRIIEKPVEENIRLREEHVTVRRKKVDRAATDEEMKQFNN